MEGQISDLLQMLAAPSCLSRVAHSRHTARPSTFGREKVGFSVRGGGDIGGGGGDGVKLERGKIG